MGVRMQEFCGRWWNGCQDAGVLWEIVEWVSGCRSLDIDVGVMCMEHGEAWE